MEVLRKAFSRSAPSTRPVKASSMALHLEMVAGIEVNAAPQSSAAHSRPAPSTSDLYAARHPASPLDAFSAHSSPHESANIPHPSTQALNYLGDANSGPSSSRARSSAPSSLADALLPQPVASSSSLSPSTAQASPDDGDNRRVATPSRSSSQDFESAAARKLRADLSSDQPLTTHGKPRERVFLACVQW